MAEKGFLRFCVSGLERMYVPSERVFCFRRRLAGDRMVQDRDRTLEYRLTLNSLMGLRCAEAAGYRVFLDIESDYHALLPRITEHEGSAEDVAATVWTGRSLGSNIPSAVMTVFDGMVAKALNRRLHLSGKALGWTMLAYLTNRDDGYEKAMAVARLAVERSVHGTASLVRATPAGLRRDWASFGAHSYVAYAFLVLARVTGDAWAREVGLRIVRKLVELQGPQGQWGWMYHVPGGKLVDFYPVYSVHQSAYSPFFLVEACDQGFEEFRDPLRKGFRWIMGENELGRSMAAPEHHVIWRKIMRRQPNSKLMKVIRGAASAYLGLPCRTARPEHLEINSECWSFEMALPLCVFSGRRDFDEILNDPAFA